MKKGWIVIIVIILAVLIPGCSAYNKLVSKQEAVNTAWSNVETQYQRRADLIPNLVGTVKGYASHEQETFAQVTAARAAATQMTVSADELTPEAMQKYNEAQGQVGAALGRLLMIQENYPELKANQNFLELQSQLEGTENRINQARRDFNAVAQDYNTSIRRFPRNILAGLFGFSAKPYFDAAPGAETAPTVQF